MILGKCTACKGTGQAPDHKAIGAEMRSLRKAAGVKCVDLAEKLGIPNSTLWDYETGKRPGWTPRLIRRYKTGVKALTKH